MTFLADGVLERWEKRAAAATRGPWRRRYYHQNEIEDPDGVRIATFNEASRSAFDDARFIEDAREAVPALIVEVYALRELVRQAQENAPQALTDAREALTRLSEEKVVLEQQVAVLNRIVGPIVEITGHEELALDVIRRAGKVFTENKKLHAENKALKTCQQPHRTWVDDLGPFAGVACGGGFLGLTFGTAGGIVGFLVGIALATESFWLGPRRRSKKHG